MKREEREKAKPREPAAKKVYRRPQILYKQPLEVTAVVCNQPGGKANPGMCPSGPISS